MAEQATPISTDKTSTNTSAPVQVVNATLNAKGEPTFNLPVDADSIRATEVVDLDFLLITKDGQRFLLPQGALQAASNPNSSLLFKNGTSVSAADQLKKTEASKPVEGGSFRINSSDLTPTKPSAPASPGDDFLQGKESKDTSSEAQTVLEQLEKISQSLQSASLSQNAQNSEASAGQGPGLGAGKGPGTGASNNNFSTSTAGSPPVIKYTTNYTSNNTNNNVSPNPDITQRDLKGDVLAKVSNVAIWDGTHPSSTSTTFGDTAVGVMLSSNPLQVLAAGGTVASQWTGTNGELNLVKNDLVLPGLDKATTVTLTLAPGDLSKLPPGFTINGQTITDQAVSFAVSGAASTRLHLSWTAVADGTTVTPQTFAIGVKYTDSAGALLSGSDAPLTFKYADFRTAGEAGGLDGHSNPILDLSAIGMSYDITAADGGSNITAGYGDDILRGKAGIDVLDGGAGINTVSYAGSDQGVTVYLDADKQTVSGGQYGNHGGNAEGDKLYNITNLVGTSGNDTLVGDINTDNTKPNVANTLDGGAGNDTLEGGKGADILIGGAGSDTASYEHSATAVQISLANPTNNTGDAAGDTYNSIENLKGSAQNDTLTGDANVNVLSGMGGDDTFYASLGGTGDTFDGGAGTDTVTYEQIANGILVDLSQTNPQVTIVGSSQVDSFVSSTIENVIGSSGNDTLTGDSGANELSGGDGNDILNGGAGNDILKGDAGDDTLSGGDGNDILYGGSGTNILEGGKGADELHGGDGQDTASYANAEAVGGLGITASLNNALVPVTQTGEAAGDTYDINIDNLTGSAFNDTLYGNSLSNVLSGGAGDDMLIGYGGGDRFVGGAGSDTVSYQWATSAVQASLVSGFSNGGAAAGDTFTEVENLIGTSYNDTLMGDISAAGNSLSGGDGNDTLIDGGGAIRTTGDKYDGGSGFDTVSYQNATAGVSLTLSGGGSGGDANHDAYTSIEQVIGTNFEDQIEGNASDNILYGGGGNDVLAGAGGNDTLYGGDGNDTLKASSGSGVHEYYGGDVNGGAGLDLVTYEGFTTAVKVDLTALDGNNNGSSGSIERFYDITNLTGGTKDDSLTGNALANTLAGGAGDDALFGQAGDDTLLGGDGNDTLDGGAGADRLTGGAGIDTVTYAQAQVNTTTDPGVGVRVDFANLNRGFGDAAGDTFDGIEKVIGSSFNDTFYANGPSTGMSMAFDGGNGTDEVSYNSATNIQAVQISLDASKTIAGVTWDATQTFTRIENLTGTANDDILAGDALSNYISGGAGDDTLVATVGAGDTLDGGTNGAAGTGDTANYALFGVGTSVNADLVTGKALIGTQTDTLIAIENLTGGSGNDQLSGDSGANILIGGDGNDTLQGRGVLSNGVTTGGDTYSGGAGSDTVSYASAASGVTASLADASQNLGAAAGDKYMLSTEQTTSIENLTGSAFNDTLIGDGNDNVLTGGGGNDILIGGAGADTFDGGSGSDTVSYATTSAGTYTDAFNSNPFKIDLTSTVKGGGHGSGDAQGDFFVSGTIEKVLGGSGVNLFYVGSTADTTILDGGAGAHNTVDFTYTSTLGVTATLTNNTKYVNIQNLTGSTGADTLTGDANANVLSGGGGNDKFYATLGGDTFIGGAGTDTVTYESMSSGIAVDMTLTSQQVTITGATQKDTLNTIENVIGSSGDDTLTAYNTANTTDVGMTLDGGDGNDTLTGGSGIDTLIGGAGNDHLTGNAGNDILNGGDGNDILDGGLGDDLMYGGLGNDTFIGGTGNDTVSYLGSAGLTIDMANTTLGLGRGTLEAAGDVIGTDITTVQGTANDDIIYGRDSTALPETIKAGGGDDKVWGSLGADTLDGGTGSDTLDYSGSSAAITIDFSAAKDANGYISVASVNPTTNYSAGDKLQGFEKVIATTGDDTLTAYNTTNTTDVGMTLDGGDGNDTLIGGSGVDTLIGGNGNDTLTGNAGNDILIGGAGNDTLSGGAGNDSLYAGSGTDSLSGGGGDDTFYIGSADLSAGDSFDGGAGNDTLVYLVAAGTTSVNLNTTTFPNASFNSIEKIDFFQDGVSTNVILSSAGVSGLVDATGTPTLTVRLGAGDTYSIAGGDTEFIVDKDSNNRVVDTVISNQAVVHFEYV